MTNAPPLPSALPFATKSARFLLAFFTEQDVRAMFGGLCAVDELERIVADWKTAAAALANEQMPAPSDNVAPAPVIKPLAPEYAAQLFAIKDKPPLLGATDNLPYQPVMIEIDQLIAFQPQVDLDHCEKVGDRLRKDTTKDAAERLCLPLEARKHNIGIETAVAPTGDGGVRIFGANPNLRVLGVNVGNPPEGGTHITVAVGHGAEYVTVAQFAGRYFVRNGYNRLYTLRKLGHQFAPVLLAQCTAIEQTGATGPGFFKQDLLLGARPPRMRDFFSPIAVNARMREVMKMIKVSFENIVVPKMVPADTNDSVQPAATASPPAAAGLAN